MEKKLLVIGAGGHARSVLDIALESGDWAEIASIDSAYPRRRSVEGLEEVSIIGDDADMEALLCRGYTHFCAAVGDNKIRHKLFGDALSLGFKAANIISRGAMISPRARLGKGICVMAGAVININTAIGDNCIINTRCSIDHDCRIMESCHIAPGAVLSGYVKVGQGAWIGTGASIIQQISIGEWCFVGAGAAVVKDLERDALYFGVPARKIRSLQ